jgi:sulfatase maturation enzyme AslB (radical SAM superfamily)
MRINNSGHYEYCRWAAKDKDSNRTRSSNIATQSPVEFFQQDMSQVRSEFLNGEMPTGCNECLETEQHGKVGGRLRQLLKTGINTDNFVKTLQSSPWFDQFTEDTNLRPVDWQVDLGNYCNSGCLFCYPGSSSRLAKDWKTLGLIDVLPPNSWCNDNSLVESFIQVLTDTPKLKYVHFIGGETLITPAFRKIIQALVDAGISKNITVGFTTNLTVWDDEINQLLTQFKEVNLGLSIECLHPVNDYLRWPSDITNVKQVLDQWVDFAKQHNWLVQIRMTPTIFSVLHLDSIFEYAYQKDIAVESCNFLANPAYMRPNVLPAEQREQVVNRLKNWAEQYPSQHTRVVNTRSPEFARMHTVQDAYSYIDYLTNQPDESYRLPDLVQYLKQMESLRNNTILDYLPEYEDFLRSAGY